MTNENQKAKASLILESALEFLAIKYGVTKQRIETEIQNGNKSLAEKAMQLLVHGLSAHPTH